MSKIERQIALEEESRDRGIKKYQDMVRTAQEKGRESSLPPELSLIHAALPKVLKALEEFIKESESGKAGVKRIAYPMLKQLGELEIAAWTALIVMFDHFSDTTTSITNLSSKIGKYLECELNFKKFKAQNKGLVNVILKDWNTRGVKSSYAIKKTLKKAVARDKKEWIRWNNVDCIKLGEFLINIVNIHTGYFSSHSRIVSAKKQTNILMPSAEVVQWVSDKHNIKEGTCPFYMPMLVKPMEWDKDFKGGYLSSFLPYKFIRSPNNRSDKVFNEGITSDVYEAVNTIQNTSWKINNEILKYITEVKINEIKLGSIPHFVETPKPAKPANHKEDEQAARAYAKLMVNLRFEDIKIASRCRELANKLWMADKFKNEDEIYFPFNIDYRGRTYLIPVYLNPQGDDVSKALLKFAEAKPITEQGACWLAIHGANLFGYDKVSLQDRINWVIENQEEILKSAVSPLENTFWDKADKPWQFLSFCFEWKGYTEEGEGFLSSMPIAMDGSCNGLQHFSAMLRDKIGGSAVNLVPKETPADVYQQVADKVSEKVAANTNTEINKWDGYINRKVAKRPVMTSVYGSKLQGTVEQIQESIKEIRESGVILKDFTEKGRLEAHSLAPIIRESISETVIASSQAMDWLQKTTAIAASESQSITWETPIGMKVLQEALKPNIKKIRTVLSGVVTKRSVAVGYKGLDKRKQTSSVAANFVHSMDAAHLMLTVLTAKDHGINNFAMVHDSYGTHAADSALLAKILRETFVSMYEENDVLGDFRKSVESVVSDKGKEKLPEVPPKGDLDLQVVKDSDYFFA